MNNVEFLTGFGIVVLVIVLMILGFHFAAIALFAALATYIVGYAIVAIYKDIKDYIHGKWRK